jgi:NADH-quinone oxidoreductase subunit G
MGLLSHLLPGYGAVTDAAARARFEQAWKCSVPTQAGWSRKDMLAGVREGKLSALYVVGANPLRGQDPAAYRGRSFLVVQDLFLHETAEAADVFLPAASAYEKAGTVTNTCGELQRLRKAIDVPGTRSDLDILARLAGALDAAGFSMRVEDVLEEICRVVPGYQVSRAQLLAGGSEATLPPKDAAGVAGEAEAGIESANDTLFTSGTMGRYSRILGLVPERESRRVVSGEW